MAGGALQEYLSPPSDSNTPPSHKPASNWQHPKSPIEDVPAVSSSTPQLTAPRQPQTDLDSFLTPDRAASVPSPKNSERHTESHSLVSLTNGAAPHGGWAALAEVFTVAVLTRGLHNPSGALDWLESRKHRLTPTDQEVRQTSRPHRLFSLYLLRTCHEAREDEEITRYCHAFDCDTCHSTIGCLDSRLCCTCSR